MRVPLDRSISTGKFNPLREASAETVPGAFGENVAGSLGRLAGQIGALGTFMQEQQDKAAKFKALQDLATLEKESKLALSERLRQAAPGDTTIFESQNADFEARQKAFIASLPADLQDEFRARTTELGAGLSLQAMQGQYDNNDAFFKQGIQTAFDDARIQIGEDGSREALQIQRARVDEIIDASGLGPAEKVAIRHKVYAGLEGVAYRQAQVKRFEAEANGIGTEMDQASTLIQDAKNIPEEEALATTQQAAMVAEQAIGDGWDVLPKRTRAALIFAQATTGLTPEILAAVHSGDQEAVGAALRKSGAETAGDLILNPTAGLDNDPAYANVPYEDRLTLTADAQRQVAADITDQKQALAAQNASYVNELKTALYDGNAGQTDIDQAREAGILTKYEDIKEAQDILTKRDGDLQLRATGQNMLATGATFAPGNEDHKKILNALVGQDGLGALDAQNSDYASSAFIPLVKQAGIVPEESRQLISGMIRSQDPEKAYWGLQLMAQIERASPQAFQSFNADDQRALDTWQARKDFLTQEEMMKQIRGPLDPNEQNARTALRKQGEQLFTQENGPMKGFDAVSLFKGTGWFGLPTGAQPPSTPWVDQALQSDFQTLFLDNYEVTGDINSAKENAFKQLSRVWGVTQTGNDNRVMKYPPEMAYPTVRDNHDWLEQQVRAEGVVKPDQEFELVADTQTESEWGKTSPSYLLITKQDGVLKQAFNPDGTPIRYAFDFNKINQLDEADWRGEQKLALEQDGAERVVSQGLQKHLEDGTTVPDELFQEYAQSGLLQRMMQGDPQAVRNGQSWKDFMTVGPASARILVQTVMGDHSPITADDLTRNELASLKTAVTNAAKQGRDTLQYEDYGYSVDNGTLGRQMFNKNDPMGAVAGVLGRAKFQQLPDGSIEVTDTYDFGDKTGEVLKDGKVTKITEMFGDNVPALVMYMLNEQHASIYDTVRAVAEHAAPEGKGREVKIIIPAGY